MDYLATINQLKASGYSDSDPIIQDLYRKRQEKIDAASSQQLAQWGLNESNRSNYIPKGAVFNDYGEIIGVSPTGQSTTVHGTAGTSIHGGWDPNGYPGAEPTTTNVGGQQVNLLNKKPNTLMGEIMPAQPEFNIQDYINQLKEAQRQSRIAALDKAKQNALSNLDTEQAGISPTYYNKRNQAAAASDIGAMNFAQYMAARGIKGSAGAMPEIYRNAALQNQLGALNAAEAQDLAAIERQRANISNAYESDVAAANADVESQAMQNLIDQWNANRQYNLQLGQLTGTINGTPTLAKQQFNWSMNPSNPEVQAQILANKRAELENIAQEIQNSYLPDTLKYEAQKLANEAKTSTLDYDTALAQLNQIKAQTANIGKSNKTSQTQDINAKIAAIAQDLNSMAPGAAYVELANNAGDYIADIGLSAYNQLLSTYKNLAGL